jgi:DNA modification methylase
MEAQRVAFEKIKGFQNPISTNHLVKENIKVRYSHQNGLLYEGDSIAWLKLLEDSSVDLVFADPPYNLNKEDWDNFESQEVYIEWSLEWIKEVARVLKPRAVVESIYGIAATGKPSLSIFFCHQEQDFFKCLL